MCEMSSSRFGKEQSERFNVVKVLEVLDKINSISEIRGFRSQIDLTSSSIFTTFIFRHVFLLMMFQEVHTKINIATLLFKDELNK